MVMYHNIQRFNRSENMGQSFFKKLKPHCDLNNNCNPILSQDIPALYDAPYSSKFCCKSLSGWDIDRTCLSQKAVLLSPGHWLTGTSKD